MPTAPAISATDVAALIPSRTAKRGSGGGRWNDFNAETTPTQDQVEHQISVAQGEAVGTIGIIWGSLPEDTPDELLNALGDTYKTAVTYLAAYLVELTYFPDQLRNERSAAIEYREAYERLIPTITTLVERVRSSDGSGNLDMDGADSTLLLFDFSDMEYPA